MIKKFLWMIFFLVGQTVAQEDFTPNGCEKSLDLQAMTSGAMAMYGEVMPEKTYSKILPRQLEKQFSFSAMDSFDSVNPFLAGSNSTFIFRNYLYDAMMYRSPFEPFSLYPQIVQMKYLNEPRTEVVFEILEGRFFNDQSPITSKDIVFSFEFLKKYGKYNYQMAYKNIHVKALDRRQVQFNIPEGNREMPLLLGLMPVFSHQNKIDDMKKNSMTHPIVASPYLIDKAESGKYLRLKRNPHYYGRALPSHCTRFAFDRVRFDFFRNEQAVFENFRAGQSDVFYEQDYLRLKNAYDFPAMKQGLYGHHAMQSKNPSGMYGFVFNLRKPIFQDKALRRAMKMIFDFDWFNRVYLYQREQQIESLLEGSDFAENLDDTVTSSLPKRQKLAKAIRILKENHYFWDRGILYQNKGVPLAFSVLLSNPQDEKYALFLQNALRSLGILLQIQTVDDALYQKRIATYDFDVIIDMKYMSLSPGTEQQNYWGCAGVKRTGTRNYAGICDPKIEQLLETLATANSGQELKDILQALDRLIREGVYYIPLHSRRTQHIFARQDLVPSIYGIEYFYKR